MKEIIIVGVGSCGINLSLSYLSLMNIEHNITTDPSNVLNNEAQIHFNKNLENDNYQARCILMDTDSYSLDKALCHPQASLLHQDNLFSCNSPSYNLYSKGLYDTNEYQEQIISVFRKEFEKCDSLQAIILNHSSMGGAGSGFTTRIARMLSQEQSKHVFNQMIVPPFHPQLNVGYENALCIYNSLLNFPEIIENCNFSLISDNNAISKLVEMNFDEKNFSQLNQISSKMLSCLTSGTRFSGLQPASLRKIEVNCIPFPRLHIFAGFHFEEKRKCDDFLNISKEKSLNDNGSLFTYPINEKKVLCSANLFRGKDYVSSEIEEIGNKKLDGRTYWIPNDISGHVNNLCEVNGYKEAAFLYSGRFIGKYMAKLSEEYFKIFRRKSFLHWYTSTGMDEMEFSEAESQLNDFQSEIDPGFYHEEYEAVDYE